MENIKLSIIIPVYNVEKYLEKCVNSVINQTYKNLEIILVNDGSTDKSGRICDEFEKIDGRIKVIHKKNGGLSEARNYGIEIASGDYIAFLDSDDWIDENLYKILYELVEEYDADIVECNFKKVYDEKEKFDISSNKITVYSNINALKQVYKEKYIQMIVAWNKLYKRDLFCDLRYPIGKIHEDEFLTPILLHKANKIIYLDRELIYYRQRNGSIMNSEFNIKKLDYLEAILSRLEYYKGKNMKLFYKYDMQKFIHYNIEYYFKIKELDIENKEKIMMHLKKNILKIRLKDTSKKSLVKIILFKYWPNLLKRINDSNKKIR